MSSEEAEKILASDVKELVYELQVHQVELEMQNEELLHAQNDLAEARDRYLELYDFAPIGYLTLEPDGKIRQANLCAGAILDMDRSLLTTLNFSQFLLPTDLPAWRKLCQEEFTQEGKSIAEFTVETASERRLSARLETMVRIDRERGTLRVGMILVDLTESREAEARLQRSLREKEDLLRQIGEAQEELLRLERLATLGEMGASVAHELRTPLAVIRNNVYFLEASPEHCGDQTKEILAEMSRAVTSADHIVRELLDAVRVTETGIASFQLDSVIDLALSLIAFPDAIEVRRTGATPALIVRANPDQITRILVNLLQNAIQAMPEGGVIRIASATHGNHAELVVGDNGPGIPPHHQERIFQANFTTKPGGTGLGLAICRRYAEINQGTLNLESVPGEGAVFRLILPCG